MEVFVEEVAGGALVTGRIVLQDKRTVQEIARVRMSRANWEDFVRGLGHPRHVKRGRIVFAPVAEKSAVPAERAILDVPPPRLDDSKCPTLAECAT